ncbi:MAG: phosphatidylglycerol lysyltransferase domain-containing protein [Paracoccaceae bacterium]|nr:phosphatidylglycerol lysyltransferase domain-containing protein [Paracoccaceae bacterium]
MGFRLLPSGAHASHVLSPRSLFSLLLMGVCLALLSQHLQTVSFDTVADAFGSLSVGQWSIAALFTAMSFAVLGQYDALFHRWLKTGVSTARARWTGAAAIALSQTTGLGLVTASLARWRLLPELSALQAFKVTSYVSFSFMLAMGFLALGAVVAMPTGAPPAAMLFACIGLAALATALVLSLLQPVWLPFAIPPINTLMRLTFLATLDVACAAAALWVLLPEATGVPFEALLAAYILALGAGLIAGTPGGVGPFELCLIALLPQVPENDLVAGLVAFRLLYYALPACVAVILLARPHIPHHNACPARVDRSGELVRAEAEGLARLPGHDLITLNTKSVHTAEGSQSTVFMGDPATGGAFEASDFEAARHFARQHGRTPSFYKMGPRSAAMARSLGWSVIALSEEAVLNPQTFTTNGAKSRQLRRHLRHAEQANVAVYTPTTLPLDDMQSVAENWVARQGRELGFSMGHFDRAYVLQQHCVLAYQGETLVAFATFHQNEQEWVLDLMRSSDAAPDGTMHALIADAIETARTEGIERFSLAAVPLEKPVALLSHLPRNAGLRRFKKCFSPRFEPRYFAAPGPISTTVCGIDILCRIASPTPCGRRRGPLQSLHNRFSGMSVVEDRALSQLFKPKTSLIVVDPNQ